MNTQINFTNLPWDTNGNRRIVCNYMNLLSLTEKGYYSEAKGGYVEGTIPGTQLYAAAIKRAKTIGGKKYHTRQYGGGIVFTSNNQRITSLEIHNAVYPNGIIDLRKDK